ncbi:hypothetical protein C8J57DRAFT_1590722 [Mycena rebaudengoi]|nr:hypothetical protein C8J57DRAFT_1590722 [Mycena rebaudengoi]
MPGAQGEGEGGAFATQSKEIGVMWQRESVAMRELYAARAKEAARQHKLRYPDYRFHPVKKAAKEAAKKEREEQREEARRGCEYPEVVSEYYQPHGPHGYFTPEYNAQQHRDESDDCIPAILSPTDNPYVFELRNLERPPHFQHPSMAFDSPMPRFNGSGDGFDGPGDEDMPCAPGLERYCVEDDFLGRIMRMSSSH